MSPLVSAIMPTRNRRRFVEQAIACFLAQDYPNRELIVVDDGEPVGDLLPQSPMFTYYHIGEKQRTIGYKRNAACGLARGEFICHWDDDDYYGPSRISEQVRVLRQSSRPATGYNQLPFAWDEGRRAWLYLSSPGYACGTSLMYLSAFWRGHRFADVQIGEDNRFIKSLGDRLLSSSGRQIVARIHTENTSGSWLSEEDKARGVKKLSRIELLTRQPWTGAPGQSWQEIQYEQLSQCGYPVAHPSTTEPENNGVRSGEDGGCDLVSVHAPGDSLGNAVHAPGNAGTSRHSRVGHREPGVSRRKRRVEAQRG